MELRQLDPVTDTVLYKEAWSWSESAPRWFQCAQSTFTLSDQRVDVGVFDGELVAVILLTARGRSCEVDLLARRGTDTYLLGEAATHVAHSLFYQINVDEIYCWLPKRNKPISKVCILSGMRDEGIRMLRGSYGTHTIEWVRWAVRRDCYALKAVA